MYEFNVDASVQQPPDNMMYMMEAGKQLSPSLRLPRRRRGQRRRQRRSRRGNPDNRVNHRFQTSRSGIICLKPAFCFLLHTIQSDYEEPELQIVRETN
jgi:hypothetical protein